MVSQHAHAPDQQTGVTLRNLLQVVEVATIFCERGCGTPCLATSAYHVAQCLSKCWKQRFAGPSLRKATLYIVRIPCAGFTYLG